MTSYLYGVDENMASYIRITKIMFVYTHETLEATERMNIARQTIYIGLHAGFVYYIYRPTCRLRLLYI